MAAFETTYIPAQGASFGNRLSATIWAAIASISTWNDARKTRIALSRLTDRELDDIGLCRGDIDAL